MFLLYTDETNVDPDNSEFFIYGGVSLDASQAVSLSDTIDKLRKQFKYEPSDLLKFNTRERPQHVSPDDHKEIKRQVIEASAKHGVKLFASFILHRIATSPDEARRKEINRVCYNFNRFLDVQKDYGLVLIDTFSDDKLPGILREKFSIGLKGLPYSDVYRLQRVLGFHLATIGSSNFSSIVDIAIGSLRYAVNCHGQAQNQGVSSILLQQLAPMCLLEENQAEIRDINIFFSPKLVRISEYQLKYNKLRVYLEDSGLGRLPANNEGDGELD